MQTLHRGRDNPPPLSPRLARLAGLAKVLAAIPWIPKPPDRPDPFAAARMFERATILFEPGAPSDRDRNYEILPCKSNPESDRGAGDWIVGNPSKGFYRVNPTPGGCSCTCESKRTGPTCKHILGLMIRMFEQGILRPDMGRSEAMHAMRTYRAERLEFYANIMRRS